MQFKHVAKRNQACSQDVIFLGGGGEDARPQKFFLNLPVLGAGGGEEAKR